MGGGGTGDALIDHVEKLAAEFPLPLLDLLAEAVERTHFDQTFKGAFVHLPQIDAVAQILEVEEGAAFGARVQNCLHRADANVFTAAMPKRMADPAVMGNSNAKEGSFGSVSCSASAGRS